MDIVIDTPQYPATSHKSPFHDGTATFMEDYLLNTRDQYYMEGGMRVYNLKEVVVTGSRKRPVQKVFTQEVSTPTRSKGTDWKDSVHKQLLMQSPDFRALA